jgi:hypothetical protein
MRGDEAAKRIFLRLTGTKLPAPDRREALTIGIVSDARQRLGFSVDATENPNHR